jgi:hypothetical protein
VGVVRSKEAGKSSSCAAPTTHYTWLQERTIDSDDRWKPSEKKERKIKRRSRSRLYGRRMPQQSREREQEDGGIDRDNHRHLTEEGKQGVIVSKEPAEQVWRKVEDMRTVIMFQAL